MSDSLWFGVLGGVLIGAVALLVGGIPLVFATLRGLRAHADAIAHLDDRITSEVKTRASKAGVVARHNKAAVDEEAQALLNAQPSSSRKFIGREA